MYWRYIQLILKHNIQYIIYSLRNSTFVPETLLEALSCFSFFYKLITYTFYMVLLWSWIQNFSWYWAVGSSSAWQQQDTSYTIYLMSFQDKNLSLLFVFISSKLVSHSFTIIIWPKILVLKWMNFTHIWSILLHIDCWTR